MATEAHNEVECVECGSAIHMGRDVIRVQEGVMGTRGIVPLETEMLLCSEDCLRRYYFDEEVFALRKRLP